MGRPRHPAAGRSGAGDRPRPVHRRSCRRALCALRAQPGRLRPHRPHHRAGRQRRSFAPTTSTACGRSGRCCTSSTISRSSSRSWPKTSCVLSANRSPPSLRRRGAEAEDIADRVEIEIAELPAVVDARDALAPDAPRVHDDRRMSWSTATSRPPDFDATLAKAHRRVRSRVRSRRQNATPLEARAAHAAFDPASGRTTLTCATQMPHLLRTAIADVLGFAESDLRVIAPDVGGGFGQKMSLPAEYVVLVWLARKLRSSVAWSEDRRENLIAAFHSRDQHVELEGAFDANGKLIALVGRCRRQYRRLFVLSHHLRRRTADGLGRVAGPLRRARLFVPRARRRDAHLHHGALSRRVAPGHHLRHRTADGQSRGRVRAEPGRNPHAQSDRPAFPTPPRPDWCSTRAAISRRWSRPRRMSTCRHFAPASARRAPRPLSRHRLCDLFRTHRLRQSGLCRARHGDHAGMGNRRGRHGPVRPGRSAHRREPARPRARHHAGADHRRRGRRRAARTCASSTATPTARPMAGAHSPAARW